MRSAGTPCSSCHRMFSRTLRCLPLPRMMRWRHVSLTVTTRPSLGEGRSSRVRIDPAHMPPGDAGAAISNHAGPNRRQRSVSMTAHASRPTPMMGKMKPIATIGLRSSSRGMKKSIGALISVHRTANTHAPIRFDRVLLRTRVDALLAVDGEREQDIPGRAARGWIAGVEDHQATANRRTRTVDRSATPLASVHRVIRCGCCRSPR